MADEKKYAPRDYSKVRGLTGLSDAQITEHLKLYEGYVKRTNTLTEKLFALASEGKASGADPIYSELTRRLGFEYNGLVLHEYYFENLTPGASAEPPKGGKLVQEIERSFGKYETWLADFRAIATFPGVGWTITYQDPNTGWLSNHWVTLHNDGNVAGFKPILVLDAWEHAFLRDYQATERAKYVDAFFKNINWESVQKRLK
jgi:Fe-Mn family superoxide dismutase